MNEKRRVRALREFEQYPSAQAEEQAKKGLFRVPDDMAKFEQDK